MAAMKALHPLTGCLIVALVIALQSVPALAACNDDCQWKCRREATNNLVPSYDACVQQGGGLPAKAAAPTKKRGAKAAAAKKDQP
jgi:hypothetical protein